jgi:sulfite exporter TauE/SafE/copper chaperone CopZ
MEPAIKTKKMRLGGLTCPNCQKKIEKALLGTAGVRSAEVSYSRGTAVVTYDADLISLEDISNIIEKLGYRTPAGNENPASSASRSCGLLLIIVSLYILLDDFGVLNFLAPPQLAGQTMDFAMLFVIGLVTSAHCLAMCGGINLSQCLPREGAERERSPFSALRPAFLYNLGRVVSYTAVGFFAGGLGGAVTFSPAAQGVLKLVAGAFMVIMGLNMLGIFPWLRLINPRMPKILAPLAESWGRRGRGPLIIGLLNGFMPCGPLQAMQIYALSTGDPLKGAGAMFLFSLGTVPLMFGLGAFISMAGRKFTGQVMTAGAVLVAVLGLSLFTQGWSLAGFSPAGMPAARSGARGAWGVSVESGIQVVKSTLSPRSYPALTVQVGMPVKLVIDAPPGSINGCNNRIFINEYGIEHSFAPGANIIEFTPTRTGRFRYACWMGMIRGVITVVDDLDNN